MNLDKVIYDSLDENFLYGKEPVINNSFYVVNGMGIYHCKNWTFKVIKREGKAFMCDTYFGDRYEEVSDSNITNYKKIFDFRDVEQVPDQCVDEYEDKDLFCVATDSGGYSCGYLHWKLKTTKRSQRLMIKKTTEQIESFERRVMRAKEDLVKYKDGTHYNLQ